MRRTLAIAGRALALAAAFALPVGAVAAESPWIVRPARGPVVLDGRLDEWNMPPSATGAFAWDLDALYVAVDVPDAHPVFTDDTSRDFARSDRVVLLVSTTPDAASEGGKLGERDYAFVFTPGSRYHRPLKTVYGFGGYEHVELDLRLVTVGAKVEASRYQLEARIPWSLLQVAPSPGLRLSIALLHSEASGGGHLTDLGGRPIQGGVGRDLLQAATLGSE